MKDRIAIIQKVPKSCCGVVRAGWECKIREVIEPKTPTSKGKIVVLEDDTLAWESEIYIKRK